MRRHADPGLGGFRSRPAGGSRVSGLLLLLGLEGRALTPVLPPVIPAFANVPSASGGAAVQVGEGGTRFDPWALVQADQVHRDLYLREDIFALEMERLWARSWLFVGHDSQVPQPGDVYATTLAGQPVTFEVQLIGVL